jgi:ribosomal protein L32
MLQRILFVVLILFVVWRLLSSWGRRIQQTGSGADSFSRFSPQARRNRRRSRGDADGAASPESLAVCQVCGTLVPAGRALAAGDGELVCSTECLDRLGGGG